MRPINLLLSATEGIVPDPGARSVHAYDPQASANAKTLLPQVEWCVSALEAAQGADVTVVLTEWNEFRAIDLKRLREVMFGNALVDLRNMYTEALAEEAGFAYYGIGCRPPSPSVVDVTNVTMARSPRSPNRAPKINRVAAYDHTRVFVPGDAFGEEALIQQ